MARKAVENRIGFGGGRKVSFNMFNISSTNSKAPPCSQNTDVFGRKNVSYDMFNTDSTVSNAPPCSQNTGVFGKKILVMICSIQIVPTVKCRHAVRVLI